MVGLLHVGHVSLAGDTDGGVEEVDARVLNGSGRPEKPDGTRGFGPGSGRKYKQMTRVGSVLGLNLFRRFFFFSPNY